MSKWFIDKTFEYCAGHRVWNQSLNGEYSDDLQCACRHLHGHEYKLQVFLSSEELNNSGMVTDFRHLEWFKKWINTYLDHKFVIDINDPLYGHITGNHRKFIPVTVPGSDVVVGNLLDTSDHHPTSPMFELLDGFLVVDFVPTSENLSKWLANIVQEKMQHLNVVVTQVDLWETPKSRSSYRRV